MELMENIQLTVKQALEQGYEHYVEDNQEWGRLRDITNFEEEDENGNFVLAEKEFRNPKGFTNEELKELLAETILDTYCCETGCDTDEVYDLIKEIDFSDVVERIDKALESVKYKMATNIKLVK